ncbi:putative phosphoglucomutase, cytoplasmic [Capsicum annuum]|nr:putative phosphoglucomutase, cytoplasmic [Capsicum annuum]
MRRKYLPPTTINRRVSQFSEVILQALEEASALATQFFNELINGVLPGDQLDKTKYCQTNPGDPNTFLGGSNHPTFENHATKALESWKNLGEKNRENNGIEFVEARRTAGLNNAPPCLWSPSPPEELNEVFTEALSANAGFVSFGMTDIFTSYSINIFPRPHFVRIHWAFVPNLYSIPGELCTECFMHTRMRRQVESLIQALDRAKPDTEKAKKSSPSRSFKRMSLKDGNNSLGSRRGHEFKRWKQPLAEMQGKAAYNTSLWWGPSPDRAHSRSFDTPDCPF